MLEEYELDRGGKCRIELHSQPNAVAAALVRIMSTHSSCPFPIQGRRARPPFPATFNMCRVYTDKWYDTRTKSIGDK